MPISTLKAKQDGYTSQSQPTKHFGKSGELIVRTDTGADRLAFLFFPGLPPEDSVVASATLRLRCKSTFAGSNTLTARRITDSWKEEGLDWDNRPGTSGTNVATEVFSDADVGDVIEVDVTAMLQQVVNGAQWFGIRIGNSASGNRVFYSAEAREPTYRPELELDWSQAPDAPIDLVPAGGRAVSAAKPVLGWTFRDPDGDTQTEANVQLDASESGFGTPDFDSGWVAATEPELDLTSTAYAGLSDAATIYWRVRVRDERANTSAWSEVESFERRTKGTLAISSPAAAIETTTPDLTSTLTGRAQEAIEYVVDEDDDGTWREVYRRGPFAAAAVSGAAYTATLPAGIIRYTNRDYRLRVRSWDTIRRAATPGDPPEVVDVQVFEFDTAAADPPLTIDAAAPAAGIPYVVVTWTIDAVPEYFALVVDGEMLEDRIVPADVAAGTIGGDFQYQMTLYQIAPRTEIEVEIQAVVEVAGELVHSGDAPVAAVTTEPEGIWLIDVDTETTVQLLGQEAADLGIGRSGARFNPIGAQRTVRVTDSLRGLEGTIAGLLWEADQREDFEAIVQGGEDGHELRVVLGLVNIPVLIDEEAIAPQPTASPETGGAWAVSFSIAQDGEFALEAAP